MRLLPVRPDHVGRGAPGQDTETQRCRHRRGHVRQRLPLRHLPAHPHGHPPRCGLRGGWSWLTNQERLGTIAATFSKSAPPWAAARRWGVDPVTCRAKQGVVSDSAGARHLAYGELADAAAALPVPAPESVALKAPKDFTLIGTPAR